MLDPDLIRDVRRLSQLIDKAHATFHFDRTIHPRETCTLCDQNDLVKRGLALAEHEETAT